MTFLAREFIFSGPFLGKPMIHQTRSMDPSILSLLPLFIPRIRLRAVRIVDYRDKLEISTVENVRKVNLMSEYT